MSLMEFQIAPGTLERLEAALDPDQFHKATFQIVSRTTAHVARLIQKKIQDESSISQKYIARAIVAVKPQGDPPEGKVIVSNKAIPLSAFRMRASRGSGVSVMIAKDLPEVTLRHAFLAGMTNLSSDGSTVTHKGIYTRADHTPTRGPGSYLKVLRGPRKGQLKYKLTARGVAGRLSIQEETYGAITKIVDLPDIVKSIDFDSNAYMEQQATSQLSRFLNPAK
jgi:hypothetical protein